MEQCPYLIRSRLSGAVYRKAFKKVKSLVIHMFITLSYLSLNDNNLIVTYLHSGIGTQVILD